MSEIVACSSCTAEKVNLEAIGCTNVKCAPVAGQAGMCSITFDPPASARLRAIAADSGLTSSISMQPRPFPGRLIKQGEAEQEVVTTLQSGLVLHGVGPFTAGVFDEAMTARVRLFQAQHADSGGAPLIVDGEVGRLTWTSIFSPEKVPPVVPASVASSLMLQALAIAVTQVGQMEAPKGSNRGPMVDQYLDSVGIPPGQGRADDRAWCMAFVFWVFQKAAVSIGKPNPLPRTAGCIDHWQRAASIAGAVRIKQKDAFKTPELVKPGMIAIYDFGSGAGHTYIVQRLIENGRVASVEGNSNDSGSRDGVGVFALDRRKLSDKFLVGFVDYSNA